MLFSILKYFKIGYIIKISKEIIIIEITQLAYNTFNQLLSPTKQLTVYAEIY